MTRLILWTVAAAGVAAIVGLAVPLAWSLIDCATYADAGCCLSTIIGAPSC